MKQQKITAMIGGQFGSEGKGLVAERLAGSYDVHVRTGGPNAGHTYYVDQHQLDEMTGERIETRRKVVARSVPVGACNPDAHLVIGPGALLDLDLLIEEVEALNILGLEVSSRILVDMNAGLIDPGLHHQREGGVDGYAHQKIGSTGEGVGVARMARVSRTTMEPGQPWTKFRRVRDVLNDLPDWMTPCDTTEKVNRWIDRGSSVMLEGTQGSGLSLIHGPWPYVTSNDTNAAQLAVDAGIAPQLVTDVLLVCRTFPIRVAGESGPLPKETTWESIGMEEERTTVTKKVRRVANWNPETVARAVMLNRPSALALMFLDYVYPEDAGAEEWAKLTDPARTWVGMVESTMGVPVAMVGTGPDSMAFNPTPGSPERRRVWPSWYSAYYGSLVHTPEKLEVTV